MSSLEVVGHDGEAQPQVSEQTKKFCVLRTNVHQTPQPPSPPLPNPRTVCNVIPNL